MGKNDVSNSQTFVVYESFGKQIKSLREQGMPADKILDFIEAVFDYGFYEIIPEPDHVAWSLGLDTYTATISRSKTRYEIAVENGNKGGKPSTINYDLVDELKAKGYKNKDIAEKVGCSVSSVEKHFSKKKKQALNSNSVITVFPVCDGENQKNQNNRNDKSFYGEDATNRNNRNNLNDNMDSYGVSSPNGSETRNVVFPANAVKTKSASEKSVAEAERLTYCTPDGEFKF